MKASRAKKKPLITDTQAINILLAKIDDEFEFVNIIANDKERALTSIPENNEYIHSNPLWRNGITFETKGSRNKEILNRIREFTKNKNGQLNEKLLSLIKVRVKSKNNLIDDVSVNGRGCITLNLRPAWFVTEFIPELLFLKSFIPIYLEQASVVVDCGELFSIDDLIKWFMVEAKLVKWKEDVVLNEEKLELLERFFGEFKNTEELFVRILAFGAIFKWKNKRDAFIEKASIKLLEKVEDKIVSGLS